MQPLIPGASAAVSRPWDAARRRNFAMVLPLGDLEKTRIVPLATYSLIALNVVIFLIQLDRGPTFTTAYAATPYEISHNEDIRQPFLLALPGGENPLNLPGRV
ncbi:MAG TPA: hypothetical protein VKP69_24155, partial [Isosphaeraceae bacterium]|nr:hypothetical protein [Isosphaeraceae bacterium]